MVSQLLRRRASVHLTMVRFVTCLTSWLRFVLLLLATRIQFSMASMNRLCGWSKTMSFKQEGLSNADAMHPYINEPGKSKKGEDETDTVKVKGTTVRNDRPQV